MTWFSVKNKLPDELKRVIVSICDDSGDSKCYYTAVGRFFHDNYWIVEDDICTQVTHWMNMPNPCIEWGK